MLSQASPFSHLFSGNSVEDFLTFAFAAFVSLKNKSLSVLQALLSNLLYLRICFSPQGEKSSLCSSEAFEALVSSVEEISWGAHASLLREPFRWCPMVLQRLNNFTHAVVLASPGSVWGSVSLWLGGSTILCFWLSRGWNTELSLIWRLKSWHQFCTDTGCWTPSLKLVSGRFFMLQKLTEFWCLGQDHNCLVTQLGKKKSTVISRL